MCVPNEALRAVILDDQMHIQWGEHVAVGMPQKRQEFLIAMPWFALRDDRARSHIERRKQGDG